MSPPVPFDIAHSRGSARSAGVGRASTVPAGIVSVAVVALLAAAHTFAHAAETSSRTVQEYHACAIVLGLSPSGYRYETCIRSLDKSLSEWDQAQGVESARSACAQKGLAPGTPAFALCVLAEGKSAGYQPTIPAR
jgi:hypothetical protein